MAATAAGYRAEWVGESQDGKPPDSTDNANYFCEYAYLYHQMDMLEDAHRTGCYFEAITSNPKCFEDKVVLDVGAGTCILSIFAAQAGAKQVYAVEATDMAVRSRKIVEAQGMSNVITVLQGTVESIKLPCKVDVIISEWMGYFLLRESMLDSVLVARDRFLKPGGSMFPSHATLYLAPLGKTKACRDKIETFEGERAHFENFNQSMQSCYNTDFSCVQEEFLKEQRKYYLLTGAFVNLTPKQLCGAGAPLMELDLVKVSLNDLQSPSQPLKCSIRINRDGPVDGFTGYFDTPFRGSQEAPAEHEVVLTTAPTNGTSTHWGQQMFSFHPPLEAKQGDTLEITMLVRRQEQNHRLLRLESTFVLSGRGANGAQVVKEKREETYYVD